MGEAVNKIIIINGIAYKSYDELLDRLDEFFEFLGIAIKFYKAGRLSESTLEKIIEDGLYGRGHENQNRQSPVSKAPES